MARFHARVLSVTRARSPRLVLSTGRARLDIMVHIPTYGSLKGMVLSCCMARFPSLVLTRFGGSLMVLGALLGDGSLRPLVLLYETARSGCMVLSFQVTRLLMMALSRAEARSGCMALFGTMARSTRLVPYHLAGSLRLAGTS
jgi:hypothetical protein